MRIDRDRPAAGPLVRGFGAAGFKVDAPDGTMGVYPALLLTATRADSWTPPPLEALDEAALAKLGPATVALAHAEGLPAHARSVALRLRLNR